MAKKVSVVLKRLNITNPQEWYHLSDIKVLISDKGGVFDFSRETIIYNQKYATHFYSKIKNNRRRVEGIGVHCKNYG